MIKDLHFTNSPSRSRFLSGLAFAALAIFMILPGLGLATTIGDYRTGQANVTWATASEWQTWDGTAWVTASSVPTATNDVYIQAGHIATLGADGNCNNLFISTGTLDASNGGDGQVALKDYALSISGKLSCYYGLVSTTLDTNPLTIYASTTVPTSAITKTAYSSTGRIKIVGDTRNLTNALEWSSTSPSSTSRFDIEIALNSNQIVTLATGIKAFNWILTSGTLDAADNTISADNGTTGGDITVGSNAIFKSNQSAQSKYVVQRTTSSPAASFTVNGQLILTGASPYIAATTITFNGTVEYIRSSAQTLAQVPTYGGSPDTYTNLKLSGSGTKTLGLNTTVNGNCIVDGGTLSTGAYTLTNNGVFQINQGGWASGNAFLYGSAGILAFNNFSGSYDVNSGDVFWPATSGPVNVSVIGAGGITMNTARIVTGTFQASAGVLNAYNLTLNGIAQINVGGYFTGAPNYGSSSTLVYNTGTVYGRNLEWSSISGAGYPANVTINSGSSLDLGANSGTGTARQISGNLTLDGALYMDFGANDMTQPLTVLGSVTINNTGTLSLSDALGGDLKLQGNWSRNGSGTFNSKGRAVFFEGGNAQTLTGVTGFDYMFINKSANDLTLNNDATIYNTLTFSSGGKITTGANKVIIGFPGSTGIVSGAGSGKYINGNLSRYVANVLNANAYYDIGDATNYTPVSIDFTGTVSGSGYLDASTAVSAPPAESGLSQTKYINRSWTVTNTGVAGFTSYSPTFTFVDGDKIGTPNTSALIIKKLDGSTWTATTAGTHTANSTQCTGLISFSEFAIGEVADAPIVTTQPSNSIICSGSNTSFTSASTSTPTPTIQWQRDAGSGFVDITANMDAGTTYGDFTTGTLTLTGSTIELNGYQYLAVFTNINGTVNSDPATLTANALPFAPTSATVDRTDFCADDAGNITLSYTGGSGETLNWYIGSCGETLIGTGNNLTIESPTTTTTYYARWETTSCGNSTCSSVQVNVISLTTPTFTQLGPYCVGATPALLPTTSNNSIAGSWNAVISTVSEGSTDYTFTPTAGQCAATATMTVIVNANVTPTFDQLGPYCVGATPDLLPTTSNNSIAGTWNAAISTVSEGSTDYTFTPTSGQCATTATMTVVVNANVTPAFTQLGPYCKDAIPDLLPTTSINGISGTWNAAISTAAAGSITYTFTPTTGLCSTTATMDIVVNDVAVADAGPALEFGSVGTAYTFPGVIATGGSILWTMSGTADGNLSGQTSASPSFTPSNTGTVTFTLTVTGCNVATDDIILYVLGTNPVLWSGSVNNSWNNPGNWTPNIIPNLTTNVEIRAGLTYYPTIGSAASCKNIVVKSGASLIDNGNLTLSSGGKITVEHPAVAAGRWHFISSPVSNARFGVFVGNYIRSFTPEDGYMPVTDANAFIPAMHGYALWPAANFTAAFVGGLNNAASYTFNISGGGSVDSLIGWNLVGNPYPSSIDWDLVTKTSIQNAVYVRNGSSWSSYSSGVGVPDTFGPEIAPTQGFFVKALNSGGGTLTFTDAIRVHHNAPLYKSAKGSVPNLVRLKVSGNGFSDEAVVRFIPDASPEFDASYDAYKLYGDVAEAAQLYTLGSTPLAINSMPEAALVPVGIKVGVIGSYTIAATEINDLQYVTLEDTETGIFTDLSTGSYTFDAVAGTFDQRFKLLFSMLGVKETKKADPAIYSYQHTVHINMKDLVKGDIYIYNIAGQQVASKLSAQGMNEIKLPYGGNYIVKVISKNSTVVRKVFILQ